MTVWNPLTKADLEPGMEVRAWTTGRLFRVVDAPPAMLDLEETPTDGYARADGTPQGHRKFSGEGRPPIEGERQDMAVGKELGGNWAGGEGPLVLLDPAHLVTTAAWDARENGV